MSARAKELNAYVTIERTDKNETCVAHAALRRVGIAKDLGHRFMDGWITLPLRLLARTPAGEEERKERRRLEEVLEWRRLRRRPIHIGIVAVVIIASHNHLHSKQPISSDPSYLFRTYGYKGPPPFLPPSLRSRLNCLLLPSPFLRPACAYQAGALSTLRSTATGS